MEIVAIKSNCEIDEPAEGKNSNQCFCVACAKPYFMSRMPTKWFQCTERHKWAGNRCAGFSGTCVYVGRNCSSDDADGLTCDC